MKYLKEIHFRKLTKIPGVYVPLSLCTTIAQAAQKEFMMWLSPENSLLDMLVPSRDQYYQCQSTALVTREFNWQHSTEHISHSGHRRKRKRQTIVQTEPKIKQTLLEVPLGGQAVAINKVRVRAGVGDKANLAPNPHRGPPPLTRTRWKSTMNKPRSGDLLHR